MRPRRPTGLTAETRRRRGEIVGRDATGAGAVARQSILAGGRRGGEPSETGLDCEHDGSSWRGRFPSQNDFSRVAGIAKLAANGKCVNGWAGSEFRCELLNFRELLRWPTRRKVQTSSTAPGQPVRRGRPGVGQPLPHTACNT
jgi:hypothetical protein